MQKKADLIIYSAAINDSDPEMIIARENNVPIVGRGQFVGYKQNYIKKLFVFLVHMEKQLQLL